jgi:hypothetical protein
MTEHHDTAKHLVDALSIATVLGTLTSMLPAIAAAFSIVWSAIRIWETDTVQRLFGRKGDTNAVDE